MKTRHSSKPLLAVVLWFTAGILVRPDLCTARESLSVGGSWHFATDKKSEGIHERWFAGHKYENTIELPGSMDLAGYGDPAPEADIDNQWTFGWRRPLVYTGAAWFEREVVIPQTWAGKRITLFLEQTRSESTVWIDGSQVSPTEVSLLTSHRHDLGFSLTPGRHRITLRLDNSNKRGIGGSYVRSAMGQGNWQGVTGCMELQATDPLWIENVRFDPTDGSLAEITVKLGNITGKRLSVEGEVRLCENGRVVVKVPMRLTVDGKSAWTTVSADISSLARWSQFSPRLYDLEVEVSAGKFRDLYRETTGIRIVGRNGKHQFTVNGTPTFLRGTVNYNIFPLTGYPSVKPKEWFEIFKTYKEWGMNHVRFHSLTPPRAAFEAADRLGIYLQCECPKAGVVGRNAEDDRFQTEEGLRILRDYGNHPSFILMSMGNELAGDKASISRVYEAVSGTDDRRLYTTTTGGASDAYRDDYKIYGGIVRGIKGPRTDWDYQGTVEPMHTAVISHEVGQWHVYPDLSLIPKYNGAMQADNLRIIRDDLRKRGLLDKAHDFTQITGAFSALLYKEEMEAIMRTPGLGGFQILMLNDFPAQGTATCGMLDIFNAPKGYVRPEQWCEFVAPVVPLARMSKRVYENGETFRARIDLANYGEAPVGNGTLEWTIGAGGKTYCRGRITRTALPAGGVYPVGEIEASLAGIRSPQKLELTVSVAGTSYRNRWNIWVYPKGAPRRIPPSVQVAHRWDEAREMLAKGKKVLFLPANGEIVMWRPGQFKTIFWSPVWLKRGVETMSVMADTDHPALAGFPTDRHTDWQWFSVLENSYVIALDRLPAKFRPIVGVIDGFRKNQRLANLLEARVGNGSLMLCTVDLEGELHGDIARTQLRNSILDYMDSERFAPTQQLTPEELGRLFDRKIRSQRNEPPEMAGAVLRIRAGSAPIRQDTGYGLKVGSKISRSGDITAWADKRDLRLHIQCPHAQDGTLYLFLRNSSSSRWGHLKTPQEISGVDWVEETMVGYGNRNSRPVAALLIGGNYLETIYDFGVTGKWFAVPVSATQMENGRLDLQISTFNVPNILTEAAFVPDGK